MRERHSIWDNVNHSIPAIFALSTVLLAGPVRAATVTSTADDGPGSLREAIGIATPGDTIDFAVSGAITLTTGELVIDKDLTLLGPGAGSLSIERSSQPETPEFRILRVSAASVTVSGLTLSHGRSDLGGACSMNTAPCC